MRDNQFTNFLKRNSQRKKEMAERDGTICNHGSDGWCGNCINYGLTVDYRNQGLGQGVIFTNADPRPDNPNGSNRTNIN